MSQSFDDVVVEIHTYFTESPPVLIWTGTAKPGPPSVTGADTTILAGIWSACRKNCEDRKWGPEDTLGEGTVPHDGGSFLGSSSLK